MNDRDRVVHAYGLVGGLDTSPSMPSGIAGAPVTLLPLDGFAALVSELDAEAYGPAVWEAHAQDPRWLEQVAREHHDVLQAMVQHTDVLPLRLPGIHASTSSLERVLRDQQAELGEALAHVQGHVELGAQIFLVDRTAGSEPSRPVTSGREYLRRRSAEAQDREEARKRRQAKVLDSHEALAHGSTRAKVNPPQDAALSGREEPMLLNAAYLVPRYEMDGFIALAEQVQEDLAPHGMVLEVTGPWPPYNFADLSDGVGAGETR
jgi:Gas vesicle synthesis protein GvpL/GvpF